MSMKDKLHAGELYVLGDEEIMKEQIKRLDRLYDLDHTPPTELEKREAMLSRMLAELGEGCYYSDFLFEYGRRQCSFRKRGLL